MFLGLIYESGHKKINLLNKKHNSFKILTNDYHKNIEYLIFRGFIFFTKLSEYEFFT